MSIGEWWARLTDWGRQSRKSAQAVHDRAVEGERHLAERAKKSPAGWKIPGAILAAGLIGFFLGHAGGSKQASAKKPAASQPPPPPGPPTVSLDPEQAKYAALVVSNAQQVTLPVKLNTTGIIATNLNGQAQVSARLAGKVAQVFANVGQRVRAGQPLLLLSSPDLAQAQANYHDAVVREGAARLTQNRQMALAALGAFRAPPLENAKTNFAQTQQEVQTDKDDVNTQQAAVAQSQSQVNYAQKTFVRGQALYNAQLLSRQDLEQEQANVQQAQAALNQARTLRRAAVDKQFNAQKRLQIAGRELARQTTIYRHGSLMNQSLADARAAYASAAQQVAASARQVGLYGGDIRRTDGLLTVSTPISGTVSDRVAMLGQTVSPGTPLLSIIDLRSVVGQFTVYQEDLAGVRVGQTVLITSNTAPGRTFSGTVSVIGTALDDATRTVKVNCLVQNAENTLRPGVYVSGTILGGAQKEVVAVPQDAVLTLNNQNVVFVPGSKTGDYQAAPVQTGETVNGMTQITQGLNPGAPFVAKNAFILKSEWYKNSLGG